MRRILLFSILAFFSNTIFCQEFQSIQIGSSDPEAFINDQTVDEQGNIYYKGTFKGALVVGGETILDGNGGYDVCLIKTDASGNLIWARNYGGAYDERTIERYSPRLQTMCVKNGFLYVLWRRIDELGSFDGYTVSQTNGESIFSKIDMTNGDVVWTHKSNIFLEGLMDGGDSWYIFHPGVSNYYEETTGYYDEIVVEEARYEPDYSFGNVIITKVKEDGTYLWTKRVESYYDDGSKGTFGQREPEFVSMSESKELYMVLSGSGDYVQLGDIVLPINKEEFSRSYYLFKFDSAMTSMESRGFPEWMTYSEGILKEDTFITFIPGPYRTWTSDDFELSYRDRDLIKQRTETIIQYPNFEDPINKITVQSFYITGEDMFFNLTVNGRNDTEIYSGEKDLKNVNIFKDRTVEIDLNGPSVSFLVHYNSSTQEVQIDSLYSGVAGEQYCISYPCSYSEGIYSFVNQQDKVWNPWIYEEELNKVLGSLAIIDGPDEIYAVKYLSDGSRYVIGIVEGKTTFDDDYTGEINRNDIFLARIDNSNSVIWYKRIQSTYAGNMASNVQVIGDDLFFKHSGFTPQIHNNDNFIKIDDQICYNGPDDMIASFFCKVSPDGSSQLYNMYEMFPTVATGFNSYIEMIDETTAIFMDKNTASTAGVFNLPSQTGALIAKINFATDEVENALKIIPNQGFSNFQLAYDHNQDNMVVSGENQFADNSYEIYSSEGIIGEYALPSKQIGFLRIDFNGLKNFSILRTDGLSNNIAPELTVLDSNIVFIGSRWYPGDVYFNETKIIDASEISESTLYSFVGQFDKDLNLQNIDCFPRDKFTLYGLDKVDNKAYISGLVSQSGVKVDSITIESVGGLNDGITIQYNDTLLAEKVFTISSPYLDNMKDVDVFEGSRISFAYTTQGEPGLNIYEPTTQQTKSAFALTEIDPTDRDEIAWIGEAIIGCDKLLWYRDADGDGYGDPSSMVEECFQPMGYVDNDLDCDDTEPTEEPCPCPSLTLAGGWSTDNSNNPMTEEWFTRKFPESLIIGGITDPNKKLVLTSPSAVKDLLPNGGKPAVLYATYQDPGKKEIKNTFLNQMVMLRLNLALNPGLKRAIITKEYYESWTVQDFFDLANEIISSDGEILKSELSRLTSTCDSINNSFGNNQTGYVVCESEFQEKSATIDNLNGLITLYPNPSSNQFIFENSTDYTLNLKVFDATGRLMDQLYKLNSRSRSNFGKDYSPGLYIVVVTGGPDIFSKKIIKN